jgi:catechol 2,3-dioxygenase-like lactoylglutathione lyase family enzyme
MKADTNNHIQLELHVPDFAITKDFYTKLGFRIIWIREKGDADDYLVMGKDGTILNFWPGNEAVFEQPYFKNFSNDTKRGYGVEIVYNVENIDEYYNQVSDFANIVEELHLQPWGLKDFRFEDPFGFYFRITEPHDIRNSDNAVD